jgi:hypothetical protein
LYCSENCRCIDCKNSKALDVKLKPDKFAMEFTRVLIQNNDAKIKEGKHLFSSMIFNSSQMNKSNKDSSFIKTFKKANDDLSRNTSNTNFGFEESFINSDFCNQAKSENFLENKQANATYKELKNELFCIDENAEIHESSQKNKTVKTEIVALASDFKSKESASVFKRPEISKDLPKTLFSSNCNTSSSKADLNDAEKGTDNTLLSKKREEKNLLANSKTNRSSLSKSSTNDSSRNDLNISGNFSDNPLKSSLELNKTDKTNTTNEKDKNVKPQKENTISKKINFSTKNSNLKALKHNNIVE